MSGFIFVSRYIPSDGIVRVGSASDFMFQHVQELSCGWVHLPIAARKRDAGKTSEAKRMIPYTFWKHVQISAEIPATFGFTTTWNKEIETDQVGTESHNYSEIKISIERPDVP